VTDEDRKILLAIAQRKLDGEDSCVSCDRKGKFDGQVCMDCLGQGVLLFQREYDALLRISERDDEVLSAQIIEV
jgi:hypothetical protein